MMGPHNGRDEPAPDASPPSAGAGRKALTGFFELVAVRDITRGSGSNTFPVVEVVLRAAPGQLPVQDLEVTAQVSPEDARRLRDALDRVLLRQQGPAPGSS